MKNDPVDQTTRHVRAAIDDDRSSVEWIVRRFSPLLSAQARMRLSGTPVDLLEGDDVVAESWLITLPRLRDIEPRAGRYTPVLLSFLATTVRALCNRRIENRLKASIDALPTASMIGVKGMPRERDGEVFSARLESALEALGEPTRTIVLLRAVEGLSPAEIAEEVGDSPNNVSHRYRRAIEKLRETLPDSVFDEVDDA